jgi:hypothetical protein
VWLSVGVPEVLGSIPCTATNQKQKRHNQNGKEKSQIGRSEA